MKSNPSAQNREGIRLNVLWPLALLMVVIFVGALIAKSHSAHHAEAPAQKRAAETASNTATSPHESGSHTPRLNRAPQPPSAGEPETERLTTLLFDRNATLQVRRQSARSLVGIGTEQAMGALKSALTNDVPPFVKVAIAESLGQSSNPEATELLHELANGKDEAIARGAARGLATRGDADAENTLSALLFNDQTPLSVRTEAALGLGDIELPGAQEALIRAISQIHDDDILESALDGMGRRPFSDTEDFFRKYLNSPDVPADAKVLAIEAVRDADGDNVAQFLSNYVNDADPNVRTAAKTALDFLSPTNPTPVTTK